MGKTILIVCAAPNGVLENRKPWMQPGAVMELAAMVPKDMDYKVVGWDESAKGPVPAGLLEASSLVMLTGLTPSYYRLNEIATFCKEHGVPVIAGGRDVIGWSMEDGGLDLLAERYPSFCTTGMSRDLMAQILSDSARGALEQHYALPEGTPYEFVIPDRTVINPDDYVAKCCIRSSSGCNRRICGWCTVGGHSLYTKPTEMLEAELGGVKGKHWFFLDTSDSFAANRSFVTNTVLPIYKTSGMRWGTEVAVTDLLGPDGEGKLITAMKKARCVVAYLGIESVTRSGKIAGKSSRKMAEQVIRRCRHEGIIVIGSLILDVFGDETVEENMETIHWARKWLDFAQFSDVAALPGCQIRKDALVAGTITETDWRKFDGANPTLQHNLSMERRSELLTQAYVNFSSYPWIILRALRARGILKVPVFLGGKRYRRGIPGL